MRRNLLILVWYFIAIEGIKSENLTSLVIKSANLACKEYLHTNLNCRPVIKSLQPAPNIALYEVSLSFRSKSLLKSVFLNLIQALKAEAIHHYHDHSFAMFFFPKMVAGIAFTARGLEIIQNSLELLALEK